MYNGKNEGFLHVKRRREKRKNDKRTEKRLLKQNKRALHERKQLLESGGDFQRKPNNNLEGNKSGSNAVITGSGNGAAGVDGKSATERPKIKSLDENRQPRKSYKDNLPTLPPWRHRDEIDERSLEDWHLFCDGDLWKGEHPYYCPGKGCGRCLHINMDNIEEMVYALSTYLPEETKHLLALRLVFPELD